jgi:DNA-3-methyladenine glycosylase II
MPVPEAQAAADYLSTHDPVMAHLVAEVGLFRPEPHTDYYYELVSSIISQQLSVKAAASIEKKFIALFAGTFPSPERIVATDSDTLRSAGLSRAKVAYVTDLAQHILSGELQIERLPSLSNGEVVKELTAVKGIGEWTAHMFLLFALGRLDVLPTGDLGFRTGVKKQYGFDHLPTPIECREVAHRNRWHPYESVATWYLWQSLNNAPS